jgi:hypothetical protein
MAEVAEGGAVALTLQARHEVRALGHRCEQLALKARVAENPREILDRRSLVAGRVDGVKADQAPKQLCGVRREAYLAG